MKKLFVFSLLLAFLVSGTFFPVSAKAKNNKSAGSVIKGKGLSTLYYLGEDGKRYVFPNDKTYFSWYDDFSEVEEVETDELYSYPLGGNARYRPGALLVKIQTDPKVYAVGANGKLHWIKTEKIAKTLYGNNWNKLVDDVPDSFFTNYEVGDEIDDAEDFDPDTEAEENPTISENRGWKNRVKARVKARNEKLCGYLESAMNRLQKRLTRWGQELPNLGDDVLERCYGLNDDDDSNDDNSTTPPWSNKKVTLCHNGETIEVGAPASRAHLRHGDTLGACDGDTSDDDQDDNDDQDDEEDTEAPEISNQSLLISGSSATATWTTDEAANSVLIYSTETLDEASSTTTVSDDELKTSHSLLIENLQASTTYYYKISSTDEAGNTNESGEASFTTEAEDNTAPLVSNFSFDIGSTTVTMTWTTDEGAKTVLRYAEESLDTASSITTLNNDEYLLAHTYTIENLSASTTYYYTIEVEDENENNNLSTEASFTTAAQ